MLWMMRLADGEMRCLDCSGAGRTRRSSDAHYLECARCSGTWVASSEVGNPSDVVPHRRCGQCDYCRRGAHGYCSRCRCSKCACPANPGGGHIHGPAAHTLPVECVECGRELYYYFH